MSLRERKSTARRRPRYHLGTIAVLVAVSLCISGCGRQSVEEDISGPTVSRTAQEGPVTVHLSVTPGTVAFGHRALLTLEVIAEKGVTVHDNDFFQTLGEGDHRFEYRAVNLDRMLAQPPDDGKLRWTYQGELEFFLPGEHELPPVQISFVDERARDESESEESIPTGPAETQIVETEPLTLVVRPPEGSAMSPEEMQNIKRLDPIDLPRRWHLASVLIPAMGAAVIVAGVWLFLRSRRKRAEAVARIPAHEWAQQQIAALIAEDLIGRGLVQEFHYRISAIVRGYIERRFGVSAPDMTTEEFLVATVADNRFGQSTTSELNRFLTACDLVKYACHQPGPGEPEAAMKAAGDFVERTREREEPAGPHMTATSPIEERAA